jgi:hypothetical protein
MVPLRVQLQVVDVDGGMIAVFCLPENPSSKLFIEPWIDVW